MSDIVERLAADVERWMNCDIGRDNEEAGMLSYEAAQVINKLRHALDATLSLIPASKGGHTNDCAVRYGKGECDCGARDNALENV